jgi:hypothetical protein
MGKKMLIIEAKIIDPEILINSIIKSVARFYDKHYYGRYLGKKNYHLIQTLENYDKERFSKAKNLHEERKKFLGEMQDLVDNKYIGAF